MSSNAKNLNDRRGNGRYFLTKVPACFIIKDKNEIVFFRVTDVSDQGLGIESQVELEKGSDILLVTMDKKVLLNVSWLEPKQDQNSNFRHSGGLKLVDTDTKLTDIFNVFSTED